MRILVSGGRDYENNNVVHLELTRFHWRTPVTVLIHGGVSGAGVAAEVWARRNSIDVVRYPPNWERHGKAAEALRNNFMLADSRPDFVMAFPGGRHTADLVEKAAAAGIPIFYAPLPGVNHAGKPGEDAVLPAEKDDADTSKGRHGDGPATLMVAAARLQAKL
jgi:hypothetical protein